MKDLSAIRAVIFDFDGTLVRSCIDFQQIHYRLEALAENQGLRLPRKSLPAIEMVEYLSCLQPKESGTGFRQAALRLIEKEELLAASKAKPIADSPAILKKLKEHGFSIAIITRNCRRAVLPVVKKYGFVCDILLTRDDVKKVKPDPEHLRHALRCLKIRPEQAIVAGDHPFEIQAGKKLRLWTAGLLTGAGNWNTLLQAGADFVLKDVRQIPFLLGIKGFPAGKLPLEFLDGLLRKYIKSNNKLLIGPSIGTDSALIRQNRKLLSISSDPVTLVNEDIAAYLLAININDIAVSGARPAWLVTTLLFPPGTTLPYIQKLFAQISSRCDKWKIAWIGGHTEFSCSVNTPVVSATIGGYPVSHFSAGRVKRGDRLLLVRPAGIEAASIIARTKRNELKKYFPARLLRQAENCLENPGIVVVKEALWFWKNFPVRVMHDPTEGGLATAIREISQLCAAGFRIQAEKIRFYPPARLLAEYYGLDPLGIISSGCLLVVLPPEAAEKAQQQARRRRIPCWVIGEATDCKEGLILKEGKKERPWPCFAQDEITRLP